MNPLEIRVTNPRNSSDNSLHSNRRGRIVASEGNQSLREVPGTNGFPLIGDLPRLLPNPLPFVQRLHAQFGNVFHAHFALNRKSLFVLGPEATEQVLVKQARSFSNRLGYADQSGYLGPEGILFRDGSAHADLRRAINPAFAPVQLQQYVSSMDDEIYGQIEHWQSGASSSFVQDVNLMTIRVAARTLLGVELEEETREVNRHVINLLRSMASIAPPVPGTQKWRGLQSRAWVQQFFRRRINQRRNTPGRDVFSCLCALKPSLSDDVVIDNMIGILAASYETTASAISMMACALASKPEWQEQLREELGSASGDMSAETIRNCERATWVFKESLRLYSPISFFPRRTVEEVELEGYTIPANTAVLIAPRFVHHMPSIYPAPETFDPARFSPQRREDQAHSFAWIPFGKGAHACIGMHFAKLEILVFFARMLKRFRIEPTDETLKLSFVPVLKPLRTAPLRLVPR